MSIQLEYIFLIAVGGAVGGVGRFWLSGLVGRKVREHFPWGTLTVNICGAALIGLLAGLIPFTLNLAAAQKILWMTFVVGVLGSFTTVSTFSLETVALLRSGEPGRAFTNVIASLGLCLAVAGAGYFGVARLAGWF